jgi:hypothetical protein
MENSERRHLAAPAGSRALSADSLHQGSADRGIRRISE